jgi:hypothetical protein
MKEHVEEKGHVKEDSEKGHVEEESEKENVVRLIRR